MSRYPAGIIRKTPVTPAGSYQDSVAPGVWTLAEAAYWQKHGSGRLRVNLPAVFGCCD